MNICVDPGKQGGLVWGTSLRKVSFAPMPNGPVEISKLFRSILKDRQDTPVIWLEKITGFMAGMTTTDEDGKKTGGVSPKSMFTFGKQVGYIEMVAAALGVPLRELMPAHWQRLAGISTLKRSLVSQSQWKGHLKEEAKKRFPKQSKKITLKTADAFLIYYAVLSNPDKLSL